MKAAFLSALLFSILFLNSVEAGSPLRVYAGTYTARGSEGIYLFDLDLKTGKLEPRGLAAAIRNPSFLALHPNRKFLYAVNELVQSEGKPTGTVSAFAIDSTSGKLTLLNQEESRGGAPCHLTIDEKGRHVLVANYVGGNAVVLPILKGGKLGPVSSIAQHSGKSFNASRQEAPHAHAVQIDPSGRWAAVADLGIDQVVLYPFDAKSGKLEVERKSSVALPPGSGPRHFAFHPKKPWAFVNNELLSTVSALKFDSKAGRLTVQQTLSTLPGPTPGNTTAEIQVHPSGRFVYVSNRGHDSIAVFNIDHRKGTLERVAIVPTGGKVPRNFGIDPSGKFLLAANQESDNIQVFRIDQKTGNLKPVGQPVECPMPVCIKFH